MSELGNFRKSLFGFNSKDVMEYILSIKNEYYQYKQESEKELASLRETVRNLQNAQKYDSSVFNSEQTKLLNEMENEREAPNVKINKATEKLESLIDEIETLINKTENN